jgi:photosystem II stability/assembly factor-like uncharacterized protein
MTLRGVAWRRSGPSPISAGARQDNGLVSAIAISPNDPNVIYQGTAGGGVWRSIDGGTTWTPQFDRQASLGIGEPGAVAIDPNDTDTLYIGTSQRVAQQVQAGLFKSTDGGNSCIRLGSGYPVGNVGNADQFVRQWINVIIVDPGDSQTVYLASTSGVFRSTDGGLNWTQGVGIGGDVRSLVLDLSTPLANRVLHAGQAGVGLFTSADGGQNWTQILSTATPAVAAAIGGGSIGKVIVDIPPPTSPPNPAGVQVLYASMAGTAGAPDPVGVFISTDRGATWTQQAATGMPGRTQGSYSFHFAVDPTSPGDGVNDIIYFGTVGQARSTDSGQNFTGLNGLHADTHAWAFAPGAGGSSTVYSGNDGGLFVSTDGINFTSLNSGGLQTALFYNVDSKPDAGASVIVGALQDNQVETTSGAAPPGWSATNGGDGWDAVYDGGIAGQLYCTSGFWSPAPCTRVWRSTDDGVNWGEVTPWGTTSDAGCYLAPIATDPSVGGTVYVSGNQNLWQSQDGGGINWRIVGTFGTTVNPSVAPSRSDNVVVAAGNQVLVSTNALAATVGGPAGVFFTDITRDLPARSVQRVAFDPNDPTVVYAVLGGFDGFGPGQQGHVFRTTVGGTTWENISPPVNIPYGALELDGSDTPTTIYVGNDLGVLRSVDGGLTWTVLDDIHFPRAPVTDLVLARDARILRAATYGRGVFEFATADWPVIAVNLQDGLDFGTVCLGRAADLTLQIFNVGEGDLVVDSVQRLMGSPAFTVSAMPGTPLVIAPGEEVDFTVHYTPTTAGASDIATIRIESNDPGAPVVDLTATAVTGTGLLVVAEPDDGEFGEVCLGSFVDRGIVLNNAGSCPLQVLGILSTAAEFIPPGVAFYPLLIAPGDSVEVPVRFQPSVRGSFSATLSVVTDSSEPDPVIRLTGICPPPRLVTFLPDSGRFGRVCVCSFRDEPLTIANSGPCLLTVYGISSTSAEFIVPDVGIFPLTVAPGTAIQVPIRFEPRSYGDKFATIIVDSDDPDGPRAIEVSGYAPSGVLALTGSTDFGLVELGATAHLELTLANVGECPLHVCRVAFRSLGPCDCGCGGGCGCGCGDHDHDHDHDHGHDHKHGHHGCGCEHGHKHHEHQHGGYEHDGQEDREGQSDNREKPTPADPCSFCHSCDHRCGTRQCCAQFRLVNNPFPTTLQPGSSLPLTIAFTPTCEFNPCCELVICTDDPDHERTTLLVKGQLRRTLATSIKCWAGQEIRSMIAGGR